MNSKCGEAFRSRKDIVLHCKKLAGNPNDICGHQYYCRVSGRWENSVESEKCPLKSIEKEGK